MSKTTSYMLWLEEQGYYEYCEGEYVKVTHLSDSQLLKEYMKYEHAYTAQKLSKRAT
jgi:hypothetical protein